MTSFKKTSFMLMLALGLLGAACGDDDKATTPKDDAGSNGGTPDAGGNGGETDAGNGGIADTMCKGRTYTGYIEQDILDNIQDDKGACANPVDIEGVCAKDPSGQAKTVGTPCFLSVSGNKDLTEEEVLAMTGDCTLNGKGTAKGLKTLLAPMSSECLTCYIDAVVCSANNCPAECVSGTIEECEACRTDKGCTGAFFECSGLPSGDDLKAAK